MANNIILKKSSVADKVPLTSDLQYGEVALNYADGKLYYKDSSNVIKSFDSYPTSFYIGPTNNNSGVTIPAGSFVMATGSQGDRLTIAKAVTNGTVDAMYMIGVAAADIAAGATDGKIITDGIVYGISTNSYTVGTVLYPDASVAGGLTSTKPTAPAIRTPVAMVIRSQANSGRILVRFETTHKLSEIQDIKIVNIQNNDVLTYSTADSAWVNTNTLNLNTVNATNMTTTTQTAGDVSTKVATTAFADNVALTKAVAMAIALG